MVLESYKLNLTFPQASIVISKAIFLLKGSRCEHDFRVSTPCLSSVGHLCVERPQDLGKDEGGGRYLREQLALPFWRQAGRLPHLGALRVSRETEKSSDTGAAWLLGLPPFSGGAGE